MLYDGRIILAAHRGDRARYPENTMPAFEAAIAFGADMIETDIRMTKDGELVIIHDASTLRTTGYEGTVSQMTLEEIRELDAGSWLGENFRGVRIPTVKEFIELIKGSDIQVNWELKDYPDVEGEDFANATLDKLIAMIKDADLTERSMINSFSDRIIERAYLNCKDTFAIHGQGIYRCARARDEASTPREELYDWCCLYPNERGKEPVDFPENFEYCLRHEIFPCVCVRDDEETYRRYVELGCRMFTTNDIVEADRILKKLGKR